MEPEYLPPENPLIERAAAALYAEMQRMGPCGEPAWVELSEGDRHVYLTYVEVVLATLKHGNPRAKLA
jgi:hypothetical protein